MKPKPKRDTRLEAIDQVIREATKTDADELSTLTYQIPKRLHQAFKVKTAGEDKKMKAVVIELIKNYLKH